MAQWSHGYDVGGAAFYAIAGSLEQDALVVCGTAVIAATDLVPSATYCGAVYATDPASCGTPATCTGGTSGICTNGHTDVVVAKLNPTNGNVLWSRQLGGVGNQYCTGLAIDHAGDVVMAGEYNGQLDLAPGGVSSPLQFISSTTRSQIFVAKLRGSDGQTMAGLTFNNGKTGTFSTGTAGAGNQNVAGLTTDANGDVYIGGTLQRSVYFSSTAILTATGTANPDAFVVKLSGSALAPIWGRRWGDVNADQVTALGVDSKGQVYAAGGFAGTADVGPASCDAAPCTPAPATMSSSGTAAPDVFLVRLDGTTGETTSARAYGDELSGQTALGIAVNRHATNSEKDVIQLEGVVYNTLDFGNGMPVLNTGSRIVFEVFLAKMQ